MCSKSVLFLPFIYLITLYHLFHLHTFITSFLCALSLKKAEPHICSISHWVPRAQDDDWHCEVIVRDISKRLKGTILLTDAKVNV